MNEALNRYADGNAAGALDILDQVISIAPEYGRAYYERCIINEESGDHKKAIADCTQSINLGYRPFDSYLVRGKSLIEVGENEKAIGDLNKAVAMNKTSLVFFNRAIANYFDKREVEAIQDLSRAIEIDPQFVEAHVVKAGMHQIRDEYEEAIESVSKAVTLEPKNTYIIYIRMSLNSRLSNHRQAINDAATIIELQPCEDAYLVRGGSYYALAQEGGSKSEQYLMQAYQDINRAKQVGPIRFDKSEHDRFLFAPRL